MTTPGPDLRSDDELVAAINDGDHAAFTTLYHRHRDWVVRVAWRFTADRDGALDVMQDVFLYVLRKTPNLRLSARFTTFIYPAIRHIAAERRRKALRHAPAGALPDGLAAPPNPLPAAAEGDDVAAMLAHLPEAQREVLLLRFVDDLSLAEIAQAMSLPLGTVKSRLHHALARLRDDPRTREFF